MNELLRRYARHLQPMDEMRRRRGMDAMVMAVIGGGSLVLALAEGRGGAPGGSADGAIGLLRARPLAGTAALPLPVAVGAEP